jgi:hypothetical protein
MIRTWTGGGPAGGMRRASILSSRRERCLIISETAGSGLLVPYLRSLPARLRSGLRGTRITRYRRTSADVEPHARAATGKRRGRASAASIQSRLTPASSFLFLCRSHFQRRDAHLDVLDFDRVPGVIQNAIGGPDLGGCRGIRVDQNLAPTTHIPVTPFELSRSRGGRCACVQRGIFGGRLGV